MTEPTWWRCMYRHKIIYKGGNIEMWRHSSKSLPNNNAKPPTNQRHSSSPDPIHRSHPYQLWPTTFSYNGHSCTTTTKSTNKIVTTTQTTTPPPPTTITSIWHPPNSNMVSVLLLRLLLLLLVDDDGDIIHHDNHHNNHRYRRTITTPIETIPNLLLMDSIIPINTNNTIIISIIDTTYVSMLCDDQTHLCFGDHEFQNLHDVAIWREWWWWWW